MIISRMLPGARFVLYYNVSEDVYALNEPGAGTLFKRRKAAELIQADRVCDQVAATLQMR